MAWTKPELGRKLTLKEATGMTAIVVRRNATYDRAVVTSSPDGMYAWVRFLNDSATTFTKNFWLEKT